MLAAGLGGGSGNAATTLLATPLLGHLDLANIVMLFLLTVLLIAVSLGRGAAVLAAVLSVLLFDIFFVPPRFSLAVNNIQYLVTFAVMLVTALFAVPVGIAGAIYLEEYAKKNWFTDVIEINIANLAGVPSIVYGLLALGLFVYQFDMGQSILAAGFTLALLAEMSARLRRADEAIANLALALEAYFTQHVGLNLAQGPPVLAPLANRTLNASIIELWRKHGFAGRVPVNLNFTAGADAMADARAQCDQFVQRRGREVSPVLPALDRPRRPAQVREPGRTLDVAARGRHRGGVHVVARVDHDVHRLSSVMARQAGLRHRTHREDLPVEGELDDGL